MQKSSLKKILSAVTIFAVAAATAFSVPVSARAEELKDIELIGASTDIYTVAYDVTFLQTDCRKMLQLVNQLRTGSDAWYWNEDNTTKTVCELVRPLMYDYELEKVAMQRAAEIAIYYSNTRPDGYTFRTIYDDYSYSQFWVEENIAVGQDSYIAAYTVWEGADETYSGQSYRRNMLDNKYNRIGVARVFYNGSYYWVMELACGTCFNTETTANDSLTSVTARIDESIITDGNLSVTSSSVEVNAGEYCDIPSVTAYITTGSCNIDCIVRPEYTYTFTDTSVAEIRNGQIYGLKGGTTTLTISSLGISTNVTVTVKSAEIKPKMTGVSLSILNGGNEDLYIYFQTTTAKKTDTSLKVVMKDGTGKELNTKTYNCADYDAIETTEEGGVNYKISYPMAITDMNKELEISVCYKGTAVYTETLTVSEYIYSVLNNNETYIGDKYICIALLNYGAAVQEYFAIDTDSLVNKDLTENQKQVDTITKSMVAEYTDDGLVYPSQFGGYIPGLSYLGTSLILDGVGEMNLRVYMMVDADTKDSLQYYHQSGGEIYWQQNLFYADTPIMIGECNEKNLIFRLSGIFESEIIVNEVYSCPYVYMNAALNQSNPNPELIALLSALYQLDKVCRNHMNY